MAALRNGDAVISIGGQVQQTISGGQRSLVGVDWVYHDGVGYYFPDGADNAMLQMNSQSGSWNRINRRYSSETVSHEVFNLWFDHGTNPTGAGYVYMALPDITLDQMVEFAENPPITVISDATSVHAVRHEEAQLLQAAFFEPGVLQASDELTVAVDQPSMLILQARDGVLQLSASNPENEAMVLEVTLSLHLEGEGVTWDEQQGLSVVVIELPGGDEAGSSVTMQYTIVPEPGALGLLGAGLLASLRRARPYL